MGKKARTPLAQLNAMLYRDDKGNINISMKVDASRPQYFVHLISFITLCLYDRLETRVPLALEALEVNNFEEWVKAIVNDIEEITSENKKTVDRKNNGSNGETNA